MQQLAERRGGRCLSDIYVSANSKLTWQCAKGHQWMATPDSVQRGTWCPDCAGMRKLTIDQMHHLAATRGGKCLSDIYVNSESKLLWQCAKGHLWMATPSHIQQGEWCPECSGNVKLTIQYMHRLAETRGGRCLSDIYVNSWSKLLWQCAKGHQWMATPNDIQRGRWCPKCGGSTILTIQEMDRLAESRGGKCLSDIYVNAQTPLLWQCRAGHSWKAAPSSVKSGTWCPVCARKSKPSMDDIRHLAKERGGKCLSQNYVNSQTHLKWECIEGHQWTANWNNIQQGQWCPICSPRLGERICREFFSQLLGDSFPKTRPQWLINSAGNQMELDGYCATLGIAFEHQGEQHYSTKVHFLHNSEFDLSRRQEDDALKSELCAQRGITLVVVPQIPNRLPLDQVRAFIKEQLSVRAIRLPQDIDTRDVDINRAYRTGGSREILNHLRTIATEHGGECLSTSYVNDGTKLLWQCAQGHKWEAIPNSIKQGTWCPYCAGNVRKTLEEIRATAAARGGKCLSPAYGDGKRSLLWECSKGHRWQASANSIRQGHWCPFCVGLGKTIDDMKNLAAQHGGQCLSPVYRDGNTKLLWQCQAGHKWETTPNNVQQGHWCPECGRSKQSRSRRLGLPEMKAIAASRGGRCLSAEYLNAKVHLLWQCKEGHQWEAIPDNIKSGCWCPVCGHRRAWQQRKAR